MKNMTPANKVAFDEFNAHLSDLIDDFHKRLKDRGFDMKLTNMGFDSCPPGFTCNCGCELKLDPVSGQLKPRCKRCS